MYWTSLAGNFKKEEEEEKPEKEGNRMAELLTDGPRPGARDTQSRHGELL